MGEAITMDDAKKLLVTATEQPVEDRNDDAQSAADEDEKPDPEPADVKAARLLRQEQIELFKLAVLGHANEIEAAREKRRRSRSGSCGGINVEKTIEKLLEEQSKEVIEDPREYQLKLFERSKHENTIAVLDTGSGKTLIAILLIRHILDQEIESRASGAEPRIACFLVPSNTLCYQQHSVLKNNLDHNISYRCGYKNSQNTFSQKEWKTVFENNMVLVCTPEILWLCLNHSLVSMKQINLLIFDEAHHAKAKHPYARIMQDYYPQPADRPEELRPRIFGMTASPVDARVDMLLASGELERKLHCKIATYPLSEEYRNRAQELTARYSRLENVFITPLHARMYKYLGDSRTFERVFEHSKTVSSELGRWAAEKYWQIALPEEHEAKAQNKIEISRKQTREEEAKAIDTQISQIKDAFEFVKNYKLGKPKPVLSDLSSKVIRLHQILNDHFRDGADMRAIVFVERKATASLLRAIFDEIGSKYLSPAVLIGQATKGGDEAISFKEQVLTMTKFRKGDINCLFATSVAEEGLDIPDCNLVIRFDIYKTMIEYVQSKGRARHKNSKFITMMEEDNLRHLELVNGARIQEAKLRNMLGNLDPRKRLIEKETFKTDRRLGRYVEHPKTGARLSYSYAIGALALFASTLPTDDHSAILDPVYTISSEGKGFICEVVMPDCAPISWCKGLSYPTKAYAKQSAAFEMCLKLMKAKHLDDRFLSTYKKRKPPNANAHLAVSDKAINSYEMQLKPTLWEFERGCIPKKLCLTIIDMAGGLERPHQPIGLLTRHELPQFPEFPIFLDSGNISNVRTFPVAAFNTSEEDVYMFNAYTLLLWDHVNSKVFENEPTKMSYWVVPVVHNYARLNDSKKALDWEALRLVHAKPYEKWTPEMPSNALVNRFIKDPWAGARRFVTVRIAPDLKPFDPVPSGSVKKGAAGPSNNILAYSVGLFKKAYDNEWEKWDRTQPVVEARKVMHRQNLLAPPKLKEQGRLERAFLCLEPMHISSLSNEVVEMFAVFPAVIHRIEDYLIALEAGDMLGIKISPALALEAMTKDSDNSDDHTSDAPINFRAGMGNNYERLEFMGDCFLKMATSISLYVLKPLANEEEFHNFRMAMISNQNLMKHAVDMKLTKNVRTMAFSRRLWYPVGLQMLEGKGKDVDRAEEIMRHSIGQKTIADVCEALIGAAFIQDNDPENWDPKLWANAMQAVTALVKDENHLMQVWEDYEKNYEVPEWRNVPANTSHRFLATKLYHQQGYKFRCPRILQSAFTHPSFPRSVDGVPHYQRLEFLGDALLDTTTITYLFYKHPDRGPQWLTEHKMAMVSNKFLSALCVKLGFHKHMKYMHPSLANEIRHYVEEIDLAEENAKVAAGDDEGAWVDYWVHVRDPPKYLADLVEAYAGALFIDSGFNYGEVQKFFNKHIQPFFADMSIYDSYAKKHPTTLLHHTLDQVYGCNAYQLLCEKRDSSDGSKSKMEAGLIVHKTIVATSVGESGRYAKERASKLANDELHGLTVRQFRVKYQCDCKREGDEDDEAAPVQMDEVITGI